MKKLTLALSAAFIFVGTSTIFAQAADVNTEDGIHQRSPRKMKSKRDEIKEKKSDNKNRSKRQMRQMIKNLGLTEEQVETLKSMKKENSKKVKIYIKRIKKAHKKMKSSGNGDVVDVEAIKSAAKEIGDATVALALLKSDNKKAFIDVLTEDQKITFEKNKEKRVLKREERNQRKTQQKI